MVEKMYNTFEAAKVLGLKTRTVREWISNKKIKAVKYNGCNHWFIAESEIERIKEGEPRNGN